jgi:hypothetical protein
MLAAGPSRIVNRPRLLLIAAIAAFLTLAACGDSGASGQGAATRQVIPERLTNTEFVQLIVAFSEPSGFFDTDNLISNETSYLHAIDRLRELGISGGVYVGVGPGQNFSYIGQVRPRIAFIIDIRRDNLLQHLLYKTLFALGSTRVEYLCLLTGRSAPDNPQEWQDRSVAELVEYVDARSADVDVVSRARTAIVDRIMTFGLPLTETDVATVLRFYQAFVEAGLNLRFESFNRPPRPDYPTLRQLLLETDRAGSHANYLAAEDAFRFLQSLESRNLIVPVVGDLAGAHALKAIGRYVADAGESVLAFYTSNVEFYLMRQGGFVQYTENVKSLPVDERSVIIRSYFNRGFSRTLPEHVSGYNSTQLTQNISEFVSAYESGSYRTYWDLVGASGRR